MAFDPGPPPKRKDYLTEGTWWLEKERWKRQKEAWKFEQRAQHRRFRPVRDTLGVVGTIAAIATSGAGHTQNDVSTQSYTGQSQLRSEGLRRSAERNDATRNGGYDDISAGGDD